MKMNKKMFDIHNKIIAVHADAQALSDSGETEKALEKLSELDALKKQYSVEEKLYNEGLALMDDDITKTVSAKLFEGEGKNDAEKEFADAFRKGFNVEKAIINEGTPASAGYLVPQDIQTRINRFNEVGFDFSDYITIEPVSTNIGSRVYAAKANDFAFAQVSETGEIPLTAVPHFQPLTYSVKDYAGIVPVSRNLISDSDQNITNEIVMWLAKGRRGTINNKVISIIKQKEINDVEGIDDILDLLISRLGGAYNNSAKIFTNDDGIAWLAKLEDDNGRKLLNPVPSDPARMQIAVGAKIVGVVNIPNSVLVSETGTAAVTVNDSSQTVDTVKIPMFIGDLKAGITCFDRQQMVISSSDTATVGSGDNQLNAFSQRLILFRACQRMDFKAVDEDAFLNCMITVTDKSPLSGVTVASESDGTSVFGHTVSTLQTGVTVADGAITGTLKYCNTGALKHDWGAGNFLVLKFSDLTGLTSVKVGLMPSASGMPLQEIMTDPDKNGVFKITDKDNQVFVVDSTDGIHHKRQTFSLSGLTLETA